MYIISPWEDPTPEEMPRDGSLRSKRDASLSSDMGVPSGPKQLLPISGHDAAQAVTEAPKSHKCICPELGLMTWIDSPIYVSKSPCKQQHVDSITGLLGDETFSALIGQC